MYRILKFLVPICAGFIVLIVLRWALDRQFMSEGAPIPWREATQMRSGNSSSPKAGNRSPILTRAGGEDNDNGMLRASDISGTYLVVVHGVNNTPVPGAEVRWNCAELCTVREPGAFTVRDRWFQYTPSSWDAQEEEALGTHGRIARTDTEGRVLLTCDQHLERVLASKNDLFGYGPPFEDDGSGTFRRMLVFEDDVLRVRVVDSEGRPASSAPVVLLSEFRKIPNTLERSASGTSGEPAVFVHAGALLRREKHFGSDLGSPGDIDLYVALDMLLLTPVHMRLDPERLPEEPIELLMPELCEAEVLLRDLDGRPVELEVPVVLAPYSETIWTDGRPSNLIWTRNLDQHVPPRNLQAMAEGGRAAFEHIETGVDLVALARRNRASATSGVRGLGPTLAGEQATLMIVLGEGGVTVTGRLLDVSGRALDGRQVLFRLYSAPNSTRPPIARIGGGGYGDSYVVRDGLAMTGSDGSFALDYQLDEVMQGNPILVVSVLEAPATFRAAMIDLTPFWTEGLHDLGDISLSDSPVLAAGYVIDQDGLPLASATVGLSDSDFNDQALTRTDGTGHFTILGLTPCETVTLQSSLQGYDSAFERDVEPGRTDLVLHLTAAGSITGFVLLPDDVNPSDIRVNCLDRRTRLENDGSFLFRVIPAGAHSVVLTNRSRSAEVGRIENVQVRAGETTRLAAIDLRRTHRGIALRVVGPDGEPVPEGIYMTFPGGEGSCDELFVGLRPQLFINGRIDVVVTEQAIDVCVIATGYRAACLQHVSGSGELRLEAPLTVHLGIDGDFGPPPDGLTFHVTLYRLPKVNALPFPQAVAEDSAPLSMGSSVTLSVPAPGDYGLRWSVRKETQGGHAARVWDVEGPPIHIEDTTEVQLFHVTPPIDPATIDASDL